MTEPMEKRLVFTGVVYIPVGWTASTFEAFSLNVIEFLKSQGVRVPAVGFKVDEADEEQS